MEWSHVRKRQIHTKVTDQRDILKLKVIFCIFWKTYQINKLLFRYTGCVFPCTYMKYEKSQEPLIVSGEGQASFSISFSTNVVRVQEEQYVYPVDSFIAEFGGALGLFLGFSFIMIWDVVQFIISAVSKKVWTKYLTCSSEKKNYIKQHHLLKFRLYMWTSIVNEYLTVTISVKFLYDVDLTRSNNSPEILNVKLQISVVFTTQVLNKFAYLEEREACYGLSEDGRKEGNKDNQSRDQTQDLARHPVPVIGTYGLKWQHLGPDSLLTIYTSLCLRLKVKKRNIILCLWVLNI